MNCKNCNESINIDNKFCSECGGKVVKERITFKKLLSNFTSEFFGWDNKYFVTLKNLIITPEKVIKSYIGGTRKRYVSPFAFLAIATTISILVFNYYAEDYLDYYASMNDQQTGFIFESLLDEEALKEMQKNQQENAAFNSAFLEFGLRYSNFLVFLFLPFYTLIAYFIFRKPYNYGEHLIINCYIQGMAFLMSVLLFLISIFILPVFGFYLILQVLFYAYVYKRVYGHSVGKFILSIFKFIGLILGIGIILFLAGFFAAYLGIA